jgi:hypothetical protein
MRSAEGGEEIVKTYLVGDVDCRNTKTPLVPVSTKNVVISDGEIEQMTGRDARRVVIIVFRPGSPLPAELVCSSRARNKRSF